MSARNASDVPMPPGRGANDFPRTSAPVGRMSALRCGEMPQAHGRVLQDSGRVYAAVAWSPTCVLEQQATREAPIGAPGFLGAGQRAIAWSRRGSGTPVDDKDEAILNDDSSGPILCPEVFFLSNASAG